MIVIDKQEWNRVTQRLARMESLLESILKNQEQIILPKADSYISIEDAAEKYKTSRRTIGKKINKYNISRLPAGKYNLVKETELIEALRKKEPKPEFLKLKHVKQK